MRILLTSGGTKTPLDDVRHIGNMSSGTFGRHLCNAFLEAGHDVTFLYARGSKCPHELRIDLNKGAFQATALLNEHLLFLDAHKKCYTPLEYADFKDYERLLLCCLKEPYDIVVLAAAVSDYAPIKKEGKISSELDKLTIELEKTPKLIRQVKTILPNSDVVYYLADNRDFHDPNLDLPTLPRVPHRALVMLRDPNVDYGKLAAVVKEDPATAADVLRVANSAAYGRLFKVAGLETAFVRLGRRTVRSILMATALKRLTIRTGGTKRTLGEELWQQAIVSGVLLGQIGQRYAMQEDEAFLLGLLHDIGKLALLRILHEYHKTQGGTLSRPIFEGVCAQWHEPLGLRLASAWKLTYPLPAIIGNHHGQPDESDPLYLHRLLVQFADVTCAMLSYGPYVPYDFFALPCIRGLGIEDADRWQNWLTCVPALIAEQAGVF